MTAAVRAAGPSRRPGWLTLLGVAALVSCAPPSPAPSNIPARQQRPVKLTILSLNDFHGQLDPLVLHTQETPPRRFRVGGAEAIAATVAELRAANPDGTLLLDGGDFMHGTLLSNHFEGAPVRELYALLGVDATAVGNHEFDFGPRGPRCSPGPGASDRRGALKAWAAAAPFPLLTATIARPPDEPPWPNVHPSALVERRGVRVGLIGLSTPDTATTTLAANVDDLEFLPLLASLRREAGRLRARGADAVVVLAHLGGACGDGPNAAASSCRGELFDLARALRPGEVDAVIAGHSHACIWRRVNGVPIIQAGARGIAVGRIELTVIPNKGVLSEQSRALAPVPVCHEVFSDTGDCEGLRRVGAPRGRLLPGPLLRRQQPAAAAARQLVARYRARIAHLERRPLVRLARRLEHRFDRRSEVGMLFAEVMRQAEPGVDVALMNAGGVRASLPAGVITYAHLYASFPFDNQLAIVRLTGEELLAVLRTSVERPMGGVPTAAGLRLEIRCGPRRRLVSVTDEQGRPLEPDRHYFVAMSDFLLQGDGLARVLERVPPERKQRHDRLIRDEIARFLDNLDKRQPWAPTLPSGVRLVGDCHTDQQRARPRHLCR